MVDTPTDKLFDVPDFRNRISVFKNREHAGEILGEMLSDYRDSNAAVFAIPAGGVPVGAVISSKLNIPLEVAVVSKITLPWNTEAGYGAIAFNGTLKLNRRMIERLGLTENDIKEGIQKTRKKVENRVREFQKGKSTLDIHGKTAILVDDGIASGFTMLVALEAMKKSGADKIIIAIPTAHLENIKQLIPKADAVYCPNIRSGWSFAVADAYQFWSDVSEREVIEILNKV